MGLTRTRRTELVWLTGTLAVVALFFIDLLVPGRNLFVRDVARVYVPERAALRYALLHGGLPYWNPFIGGGQPLAANPAYEAFYPPQWLLFLADARTVFHVEVILHYLLAAAGMYLLLRSLGLHPAARVFGALSFALGGMLLSTSNLVPFLFSLAWFPWLALFTRRFLRGQRLPDFAAAALIVGLILLIGEQSMILQAGALLAAYAIRVGLRARPLVSAAAIVLIATLVGAVQIFPALDHQRDSGRSVPMTYDEATLFSMTPLRPLELFAPNAFMSFDSSTFHLWSRTNLGGDGLVPWIFSFYAGLLTGALILTGFIQRTRGYRLVAVITAISIALALGRYGPFYRFLYAAGLKTLRYPEKFFLGAVFALTVFAAMVAGEAMQNERVRKTLARVMLATFLVTFAGFLWTLLPSFEQQFDSLWHLEPGTGSAGTFRSGWLGTVAFAAAFAFLIGNRRLPPRVRVGLLLAVVLLDLGVRVPGLTWRVAPGYYAPPPLATALHREPGLVRIYNDADWNRNALPTMTSPTSPRPWINRAGLFPDMNAIWELPGVLALDVTNMNLLPSRDFEQFFVNVRGTRPERLTTLLQMAGVTHIALLKPPSSPDDVEYVRVIRADTAGRYYFASSVAPTEQFVGQIVRAPTIDAAPAFVELAPLKPAAGKVLQARESANEVDLDVEAEGQALLVIAISAHKYWRATIDGQPAQILPTNMAFQSLVIPRGRHTVHLRYRNPLTVACLIVSACTVLALLAIAAGLPRSRAPQPRSRR
jgi:hypothetical protein